MNYSPHLNIATRTARVAGSRAMERFERRYELNIRNKGENDFVTDADTAVEQEILSLLRRAYPQYGILTEEDGNHPTASEWRWIIDPIDGTTNFIHGVPHFAISIALAKGEEIQVGVVYNPATDELFAAERGRGAFLNDQRLRVSSSRILSQGLFATGFPVNNPNAVNRHLAVVREILVSSRGIRRCGSAALDLAYVASGRYDGFWEPSLAPWDIAAGLLIVMEAGGLVSDFKGENNFLRSGNILAANPAIHALMLAKILAADHA